MTPSVGRIVHYTEKDPPNTIRPAIIAMVDQNEGSPPGDERSYMVALRIVRMSPMADSGELRVPFSETYTPGCWSWPPRV